MISVSITLVDLRSTVYKHEHTKGSLSKKQIANK